jgi:hypothetical protein
MQGRGEDTASVLFTGGALTDTKGTLPKEGASARHEENSYYDADYGAGILLPGG